MSGRHAKRRERPSSSFYIRLVMVLLILIIVTQVIGWIAG